MPANKKKREQHRKKWKLSSRAGKTAFFIKTPPELYQKCSQKRSKIPPKWSQKGSQNDPGDPPPKKIQKDTLKCSKGLPKMTPKRSPKSQKTVWVAFFSHRKNYHFWEAVFSCFLSPPGGPRPSKSSQNAIKVCKNKDLPFSSEATFFTKINTKRPSFGTPRGS